VPWHRPYNLLEASPHQTVEEDSYGNQKGNQKEIKQREENQQSKEILSEEVFISQVFSVRGKER
jgi:hypothetical protein